VVIDGLPSGFSIDQERLSKDMARRRPSQQNYSTKRREPDEIEMLSGYHNDRTTGTPLCAIIRNRDTRSKDYSNLESLMRPGHADYSGHIRYKGFNDIRGGGHFSGRLTAPIVFAGSLAAQILSMSNIFIGSHIDSVFDKHDVRFDDTNITEEHLNNLKDMDVPVNELSCREEFLAIIEEARKKCDSVGGVVETAIIGVPAGVGSPIFDNVESNLASFLFSIPAVKGVEFGEGFSITSLYGSQSNDSLYMENGKVLTRTNNNGGINGGITNGMPLIVRTAVKPTSSIAKKQDTININTLENAKLEVKGRHDSCIVPRVVPVIDSACAITILDMLIGYYGLDRFNGGKGLYG
jgi:chorismate synthase